MNQADPSYLSGPMTGYPDYNYPMFQRVATSLRRKGWNIISPHEVPPPEPMIEDSQKLWEYYMEKCKEEVAKCKAIILCNGWPESRGARQELEWALGHGHEVYYYDEWAEKTILMSRQFRSD